MVFNAVTNWPIETVGPSAQDLVYIEVWPPHIWFQDLHNLIVQAQELGNGKPVVLAAYIDPSLVYNVFLINAAIFGSGGSHIEIGERDAMLADPYFPNYQLMSPGLALAMQSYYDFAVRYQDVIGPRTRDITKEYQSRIEIEGVFSEPSLLKNKVWPIVRQTENELAISLINLLGVNSPDWARPIETEPNSLGPTRMRIRGLEREIAGVWFATPDGDDHSPQGLDFEVVEDNGTHTVSFQIPSLVYWDLLVIKWRD